VIKRCDVEERLLAGRFETRRGGPPPTHPDQQSLAFQ
jgi:hypothetical protein